MQEGHYCSHGNDAYSYATCIQTMTPDHKWVYNVTQYSVTTSKHQAKAFGFARSEYKKNLGHAIMLDNVPKGSSADDLRALASKVG